MYRFMKAIMTLCSVLSNTFGQMAWEIKKGNYCICFHWYSKYRDSYKSAHVLLDLLNELRKRYEMRGLLSILSLIRN